MAGVRLKWLTIEKYRNVAPGTELHFSDGFNVLLGKNGTGKTTLLDLIAAAVRFDFTKLRDEPCALQYEVSFSTGTIEVAIRNTFAKPPERRTPLLQATEAETPGFLADLRIRLAKDPREWTVHADASYVWTDEPNRRLPLQTHPGERGPSLLLSVLRLLPDESLFSAYDEDLEPCATARRFDEALDVFREITGAATWIQARYSSSKKTVLGFSSAGLVPAELFPAMGAQAAQMSGGSQGLTIPSDSLGFLRASCALFGFPSARLEMRLEKRVSSGAGTLLTFSDLRFMFEANDGSLIKHEDLSFGQKRLLAFLYYAACSPSIIIADELVNGLHHDWAQACLDQVVGRQSFLAGQDPLLFDFLFFESVEEVQKSFVLCSLEQRDGRGHFVWKNLDPETAASFYRAYEAGIQHVSEILHTKGLW